MTNFGFKTQPDALGLIGAEERLKTLAADQIAASNVAALSVASGSTIVEDTSLADFDSPSLAPVGSVTITVGSSGTVLVSLDGTQQFL